MYTELAALALIAMAAGTLWWAHGEHRRRSARKELAATRTPSRASIERHPISSAQQEATANDFAMETVARAFPVRGLPENADAPSALEQALRQVAGVTSAYVSHLTKLVFLEYHPTQVTEEKLVTLIERGGYQVAEASRRFDWRHARSGP